MREEVRLWVVSLQFKEILWRVMGSFAEWVLVVGCGDRSTSERKTSAV